jgi:hypothetical protein
MAKVKVNKLIKDEEKNGNIKLETYKSGPRKTDQPEYHE